MEDRLVNMVNDRATGGGDVIDVDNASLSNSNALTVARNRNEKASSSTTTDDLTKYNLFVHDCLSI